MGGGREPRAGGRGPERLGDILERVLRESGILDQRQQVDLVEAWRDVAGPDVAELSFVETFRGGVMTVGVQSAALRQELERYRKDELLRGLRERMRGVFVEELRFRLV